MKNIELEFVGNKAPLNELKKLNLEDLTFVWNKYNLEEIKKNFEKRFKQIYEKTDFQDKIFELGNHLNGNFKKEDLISLYEIKREDLEKISGFLNKNAQALGIDIEYVDMSNFSEDDFYQNEHKENHEKHAETARSDGKTLLLEKDVLKAGNIEGRIYDIMHLAFGHMIQWSSDDKNLLLNREEAWAIGYRNHEKSPDKIIDLMSLYEFEAGMLGVEKLRQVVEQTNLTKDIQEKIIQYFVDYAYADRKFIIQHYRGNYQKFESFWKFGNDIPPRQSLPKVDEFIKRHAVEIGLLREK